LFIIACTSKQIEITDTTKISLENIKNKTFFKSDYSSGIVGGSFGHTLGELSLTSSLQGYYVTYKILDYNNKPISKKNISNNQVLHFKLELAKYIVLSLVLVRSFHSF
jgi:hypothetical protein